MKHKRCNEGRIVWRNGRFPCTYELAFLEKTNSADIWRENNEYECLDIVHYLSWRVVRHKNEELVLVRILRSGMHATCHHLWSSMIIDTSKVKQTSTLSHPPPMCCFAALQCYLHPKSFEQHQSGQRLWKPLNWNETSVPSGLIWSGLEYHNWYWCFPGQEPVANVDQTPCIHRGCEGVL